MTTASVTKPVLHHVNLKTRRLAEMIDWYGTVVGMTPNHRFDGGAWLTNDEANHRLALLAPEGIVDDPDKIAHAGLHHIAFEYPSLVDLLDAYERLRPLGIEPHACLDHGMTISFYYVDPDGNSVELQADNFGGDWSRSSAFLHTPEFRANPIGVTVDPAKMLAERVAGVAAEELHRRAYLGEFSPETPLDLRLPEAASS